MRECGLKCDIPFFHLQKKVTPRAGVWIEILIFFADVVSSMVTPRAGVWIEMNCDIGYLNNTKVTPRAGVWIEI